MVLAAAWKFYLESIKYQAIFTFQHTHLTNNQNIRTWGNYWLNCAIYHRHLISFHILESHQINDLTFGEHVEHLRAIPDSSFTALNNVKHESGDGTIAFSWLNIINSKFNSLLYFFYSLSNGISWLYNENCANHLWKC